MENLNSMIQFIYLFHFYFYFWVSWWFDVKCRLQMTGIRQFGLGEGVDASGVTTKILTCNCSMALMVDNKSKLFGLHIHPPLVEISFDHHPFATSHVRHSLSWYDMMLLLSRATRWVGCIKLVSNSHVIRMK